MALTRKMLKAMSIEDDKIEQIIEAHTETVNSLKEERDRYKEDAEKLPEIQKELNQFKTGENWQEKYEKEHKDFEIYKTSVATEKATEQKKALYKQLLVESKVDEKRIDAILKVTDLNTIKVDKDGKLEDAENLKKSIATEWAGFIVTDGTKGAEVNNPPEGNGGNNNGRTGRAAELAKQYHANLYGVPKKEE